MTTENMTKRAAGVHTRTGSTVWQWKIRVPLELRSLHASEWACRTSLKTSDLKTANATAAQLQADWTSRFDEQRKSLNPQRVDHVTPEMGKMLAGRITSRILGMDERLRTEPATARLLLDAIRPFGIPHSLLIGPYEPSVTPPDVAPLDPLEGMPLEMVLELADLNAGVNAVASQQMAMQRVAAVLPLVKDEARSLGLIFDEKAPGAMDALRECLRAFRKAWQEVSQRDDGQAIETPQAPTVREVKQAKPTTLRGILPQWKASKTRKAQTVQAAELALSLYEKATGNPPITSLTRAQGDACRAFLLAQGTAAKTARDRFDYIKGFLNFASRELELLPRNPWEGLAIEYTTTKPRRPWSAEQLKVLFSKPLFTTYTLPTAWGAGGDAAYWIPILGLYTGARIGELCQLETTNIEKTDGVDLIHITDLGEGQSVKTAAGRRLVPVHPELIRLGFLEYVDAIKKAGAVRLFPALPLNPSKPSNYFSDWFSTIRPVKGEASLPDFHSLRHTVRTKLAGADIAEPMIDTLIGHEVKGSTGAKTYTQRDVSALKKAMATLTYTGLSLPRVFSSPSHTRPPAPRKRGRPASTKR